MNGLVFTLTSEELEDTADHVKMEVIKTLAAEGIIKEDVAEKWSKTHTVITRKKTFFRTLSVLWSKEKEANGVYYLVVKIAEPK